MSKFRDEDAVPEGLWRKIKERELGMNTIDEALGENTNLRAISRSDANSREISWVEVQPDWEKGIEQFKVGDRVRVYSGNNSADGMIERIGGKYPVLVVKFKHSLLRDKFHWKQCALLKKREPREFWINPERWGVEKEDGGSHPDHWIKVREVLGEGE